MPRGSGSPVGSIRVAQNGYQYTKTTTKWRLTHHIIAEEMLGRPLRTDERVVFLGSKTILTQDNIKVIQQGTSSDRQKLARIEARLAELNGQRDEIMERLAEKAKESK